MTDISITEVERELAGLLPSFVHGGVAQCGSLPGELLAEEANQAQPYGKKRLEEFTTTRLLVRSLLEKLGQAALPLLSGRHREPIWPKGVVGSITHSGGIVIALVARQEDCQSLGVDLECRGGLVAKLFDKIFRPEERAKLLDLDEENQSKSALQLFSAKEAFYKAQFPMTHRFVGFEALSLSLPTKTGNIACTVVADEIREVFKGRDIRLTVTSTCQFALAFCYVQ